MFLFIGADGAYGLKVKVTKSDWKEHPKRRVWLNARPRLTAEQG